MERKKRTVRRRERPEGPPAEPEALASASLREQARGWGDVAREAYDDCEKGRDAEAELHRRRNRSGQ